MGTAAIGHLEENEIIVRGRNSMNSKQITEYELSRGIASQTRSSNLEYLEDCSRKTYCQNTSCDCFPVRFVTLYRAMANQICPKLRVTLYRDSRDKILSCTLTLEQT